jgi:hypothetical protein
MTSATGESYELFSSFVEGSLARQVSDDVNSRLTPGKSIQLFSSKNFASKTFVRNPDCWAAGYDLTCESVTNSRVGDGECGGALIAPDIARLTWHFNGPNGAATFTPGVTRMYWTDLNNVTYERTVIGLQRIGGGDTLLARLDSPLPDAITPARLLPFGALQFPCPTYYHSTIDYPYPVIKMDQWKQASVAELIAVGVTGVVLERARNSFPQRQAFYQQIYSGDSGSGIYTVIGGVTVLLSGITGVGRNGGAVGSHDGYFIDAFNAAIDSLGGEHHAESIDLSSYPSF